ncbi:MAG: NusG domain II-containing protein [Oscillospiraceae bacterium]|nr:NusG domain II-containing protein [Oscillospiraceae bacterium]MDE6131759.1 NusG domain II-containing protein [Oscillospiraceae bacterium]
MENNERKLLRLRDVFIIVSIIAAVLVFYTLLPDSGGGTAVVLHDGGVIAEIPLDGSGEYTFPQVPDMVFTAGDGAVSVTASGCGDKTCIRTGKISGQGEAIICVPNKIVVQIKGSTKESGVDAVL